MFSFCLTCTVHGDISNWRVQRIRRVKPLSVGARQCSSLARLHSDRKEEGQGISCEYANMSDNGKWAVITPPYWSKATHVAYAQANKQYTHGVYYMHTVLTVVTCGSTGVHWTWHRMLLA